jgi:phytoene dehydrogenase-like protein
MPQPNSTYDALVIGSGPNGLAAAIRLAQEGLRVKVFEAAATIGGGTRTLELIEPGYFHDVCSAIHPMALASPYLRRLPLAEYGLELIHPDFPVAHPLDGGRAALLQRDLDATADSLGDDARLYRRLMRPLVNNWEAFTTDILGPLGVPSQPIRLARFGLGAMFPASLLALKFKQEEGAALFGGIAAHSILDLDKLTTAAIGLVLGSLGHAVGWPIPRGGSRGITDAMARYFTHLGGEIETGMRVTNLAELPPSRAIFFNLAPRQVAELTADRIPAAYRHKLLQFRYGAGVFKIDYILKSAVPWTNPDVARAGTVHLGGTFAEIAESEKQMASGQPPQKPYVLVAQQSTFDRSRVPAGSDKHTLWAYCHVPNGSQVDMTAAIEDQIERFAPGFRDVVEARVTMNALQMEAYNPNYVGGDINAGAQDIFQLFSRPVSLVRPYRLPGEGLYMASSSTPPGGGVHGMGGFYAAEDALGHTFGISPKDRKFRL